MPYEIFMKGLVGVTLNNISELITRTILLEQIVNALPDEVKHIVPDNVLQNIIITHKELVVANNLILMLLAVLDKHGIMAPEALLAYAPKDELSIKRLYYNFDIGSTLGANLLNPKEKSQVMS